MRGGGGASGVRIRDIRAEDFPAVRLVACETWADAYRDIVSDNVQDEFVRRAY